MDPNSKSGVNYQVLFEAWGVKLSISELEEIKISTDRALKVVAKYMVLKSIIKSQRIIGNERITELTGIVNVPDMITFSVKSWQEQLQELKTLTITEVGWWGCSTIGFTLSDR